MGWKNANLRSELTRLLRRAGLSGWPRIAQQSYLLVTEDDFAGAGGAMKVMVEG